MDYLRKLKSLNFIDLVYPWARFRIKKNIKNFPYYSNGKLAHVDIIFITLLTKYFNVSN